MGHTPQLDIAIYSEKTYIGIYEEKPISDKKNLYLPKTYPQPHFNLNHIISEAMHPCRDLITMIFGWDIHPNLI